MGKGAAGVAVAGLDRITEGAVGVVFFAGAVARVTGLGGEIGILLGDEAEDLGVVFPGDPTEHLVVDGLPAFAGQQGLEGFFGVGVVGLHRWILHRCGKCRAQEQENEREEGLHGGSDLREALIKSHRGRCGKP